jgi:hypothetical protein
MTTIQGMYQVPIRMYVLVPGMYVFGFFSAMPVTPRFPKIWNTYVFDKNVRI